MVAVDVKDARYGSFAGCYLSVLLILTANTDRSSASNQQVINRTDDSIMTKHESIRIKSRERQLPFNDSSKALDPYRKCNLDYFDRNFSLTNPKYPQRYDNDLSCTFTVHRAKDVCEFQLVFRSFELEESEGCLADYLEVNGQRFCGILPPDSTRTFAFMKSEIRLRFHTDSVNNEKGFLLEGSQIECGNPTTAQLQLDETQQRDSRGFSAGSCCNCSFEQPQFEITSPGFPASYEPDLHCDYAIRKSGLNVCYLEATFLHMDLDFSPGCQYEYLKFDQWKVCFHDNTHPYIFEFARPVFNVHFRSSTNRLRRTGFRISIRQLPCSGLTTMPSMPPQPVITPYTSGFCPWTVSQSAGNVQSLHIELQSLGYPKPYPSKQHCQHIIRKASPSVCFLEFIVQSFHLEVSPSCQNDYLSIGEQRFCGMWQPGTSKMFHFPVTGEIPIAFVSDDDQSSYGFSLLFQQKECLVPTPPPQGSHLQTPPVPGHCDDIFASKVFKIQSPTTFNSQCTYTIKKIPNVMICTLKIAFDNFDFGSYNNFHCKRAFLDIEGNRLCEKSIQGTIRTYNFPRPLFVIRFWSDFHPAHFRLSVSQHPCVPFLNPTLSPPTVPESLPWQSCGSLFGNRISSHTFQLRSSHYPNYYDANLNCDYTVAKASPQVCHLRVQFSDFDLEESFGCQNDFLEIGGERLCGCYPSGTIKYFDYYGSEMVIRFHSNNLISGRGFLLEALQLNCYNPSPSSIPFIPLTTPLPSPSACNHTYQTTDVITLRSEASPAPYVSELNCYYIICKARPDICHLEVEFAFFQMGITTACGGGDFLDVGGQRHCGIIPPGTIRRYNFPSNWLLITILSQSDSSSGNGYLLRLRQIPCKDLAPVPSSTVPYYPTPTPDLGDCDLVSSESEFTWVSPHYPASYGNNQDCLMTVQRNNPSVCSLLIQFNHFALEASMGCTKDYLELFGHRFCGPQSVDTKRSFPFNQAAVMLKFHSDNHGTSSGFHAKIIQQDCLDGPIFRMSNALRLNATDHHLATESAAEVLINQTLLEMSSK